MDNVTHSLAGLLLAESALRLRARRTGTEATPRLRTVAAISSMVAANLPDADLLYSGMGGGDHLGYMLHHRGHTHTVVIAMLGAVVLWVIAALWWRWRAPGRLTSGDKGFLLTLLLVSTLSHLVLDWTNSYGVHPFWPFDERWRYGDAVFIVEPWLWVVSVPTLVAASTRSVARVLLSLVLIVGLVLAWRVDFVSTGAAAALTGGALLFVIIARPLDPSARAVVALAGWVVVTLVMATGSARARGEALQAVHAADPTAEVLDVVVSPLPANAVCMSVITVERSGAMYRAATARVSSAPWMTPAAKCASRQSLDSYIGESKRASSPAVEWDGEWTAPVDALATLVRESCPALAAMRFIRVPIWRTLADSAVLIGDIRFGGGSGGFTDVRVPRLSKSCPPNVPPWAPPRDELLRL
jgi:inner membrane protein